MNTRSDNTEAKAALRREIEASQAVHAELDDSHSRSARLKQLVHGDLERPEDQARHGEELHRQYPLAWG